MTHPSGRAAEQEARWSPGAQRLSDSGERGGHGEGVSSWDPGGLRCR